jgi:hypothetical protein
MMMAPDLPAARLDGAFAVEDYGVSSFCDGYLSMWIRIVSREWWCARDSSVRIAKCHPRMDFMVVSDTQVF